MGLGLDLLCHDRRGPPPNSSQCTAQKAYHFDIVRPGEDA